MCTNSFWSQQRNLKLFDQLLRARLTHELDHATLASILSVLGFRKGGQPKCPLLILSYSCSTTMVREIEFNSHREIIESFRRASYGSSITHVLDEFDELAHHFALFDKKDKVLGVTRILRSDEVKQFEMMRESQLKDLVLPPAKLSLELSRACTIKGSAGIHLLSLCMGINEYAVKNEAEYLITKTGKHLLSMYQHFGFTTFGPPFVSDFFEDKRPIYPIMYRWTVVKREVPEEEVFVW